MHSRLSAIVLPKQMLIKRLVLQISDDVIRVGVISYATAVRVDADLGALSDVNTLTDTVWAAEYMAGITNTADGLAEAHRFDLHHIFIFYFLTTDPYPCYHNFQKILETLFNEGLEKFIDKFQLLNNCQYGFRFQMSTSHALMDLVEEITSSIDANKISIGVFIDLKKAFDTVNHTLLIDKLEYYGIRGIAQEWLKCHVR